MQPARHAVAADLLCTWAKAQQQTHWPLPLTMISGTDRWTQTEGWSDRQTPQTLYDTFTVYYVDHIIITLYTDKAVFFSLGLSEK